MKIIWENTKCFIGTKARCVELNGILLIQIYTEETGWINVCYTPKITDEGDSPFRPFSDD